MPLSLADRILSYRDTGNPRGAARRAPEDHGSRDPGHAGREPGCAPDPCGARLRGLFADVARDGSGLAGAVGGLRKAIVGSALEHAIGAAGVRVGEGGAGTALRGTEELP